MRCNSCGTEVQNSERFCPKCGADLSAGNTGQASSDSAENTDSHDPAIAPTVLQPKTKKPKHTKAIIIGAVAAVVVVAVVVISVFFIIPRAGNPAGSGTENSDISEADGLNATGEIAPVKVQNIGGSRDEYFYSIATSSDGSYVAAGYSYSNDGDIPGNNGGTDAIIAKFDQGGNLVWVKNIGGSNDDMFYSVTSSSDGGYVAAGYSYSNDGDIPGNHGRNDAIIAKFDQDGNLVWLKNIGGSGADGFSSIAMSSDDGFVAVGWSYSNDGDIPGNHGGQDAIIAKFDQDGNLVWLKNIGGSGTENFASVAISSDGGYVAVGWSSSSDGDIPDNHGDADAIIAKFDQDGNLAWV